MSDQSIPPSGTPNKSTDVLETSKSLKKISAAAAGYDDHTNLETDKGEVTVLLGDINISNFTKNTVDNESYHSNVHISSSPATSSNISVKSCLSTSKSNISVMSEISQRSLKSFQLCTKTPPNTEATSFADLPSNLYVSQAAKRILCVGLCSLDIVHICAEYPLEKDKQLLKEGYWQRSGNASNNCTVLRNLGAQCEFLGVLSSVPAFKFLQHDCQTRGIIIDNCPVVQEYPAFSSIIACRPKGTFTIIHTDLGFPILKFKDFKEKIQLRNYSWIHFEARNPEETKPMINMIRQYNSKDSDVNPIMLSLELAKVDRDLLTLAIRVNLVFVGREFALNLGWSCPKDTVYNLRQLVSNMQLREEKDVDEMELCFRSPHIVCPWASEGCCLLTSTYDYQHIPARLATEQVVDARGSGDTLVAAVIYAANQLHMDFKQAVEWGYRLAEFKMQHWGLDCIKEYKTARD